MELALIKLAGLFVLILIFLGLRKPFHYVIFGATILAGVLYLIPIKEFLLCCWQATIDIGTIELLAILWLIMLLEGIMRHHNYLGKMNDALDELFHSKRISILAMPIMVGLLPSAGGTLLSAGIVAETTEDTGLSAARKSAINCFYRHIPEIFFPVYPAMILLAEMTRVSLGKLVLVLLPIAVLAVLAGLWMLRDLPKQEKIKSDVPIWKRWGKFLLSIWPFLAVLGIIFIFDTKIYIACAAVIAVIFIITRTPIRLLPRLIKENTRIDLLVMTLAVMIFVQVLLYTGTLDLLPELFVRLPLPPILIFSFLMIIVMVVTSWSFSAVALLMPIFMIAIPDYSIFQVALMQISFYFGSQFFPTHLCLPLSCEYFDCSIQSMLKEYWPVYVFIYVISVVFYGFLLA